MYLALSSFGNLGAPSHSDYLLSRKVFKNPFRYAPIIIVFFFLTCASAEWTLKLVSKMASKAYKEWWPKTCYTKHTNARPPSKIKWSKLEDFINNPAFDDKEGLQQKILMLEEELKTSLERRSWTVHLLVHLYRRTTRRN